MAIPRFDEDLAIISKLGDNPGSDNNLTTDAFRAKFDEGPQKIQKYLNDVLIPAAEQSSSPQEGLSMQGGINMNGHALKGLNAPTADDEAANKGYVDANKVDKSHVVNNFTTTEEGFVADARALKVLNDSKLSMELGWENASPTSAFAEQYIPIQGKHGEIVILEIVHDASVNHLNSGNTAKLLIPFNEYLYAFVQGVYSRRFSFTSAGISVGNSSAGNAKGVPWRIWIIKGVSV